MKHAFTTVELLVASALATVLMAGVLHVAVSVRLGPEHAPRHEEWTGRLIELIRWDLANAKTIQIQNGTVSLVGYGFLATNIGRQEKARIRHRPVRVEYTLVGDDSPQWLIRRQTHLDELSNKTTTVFLVCGGVVKFELQPQPGGNQTPAPTTNSWAEPYPVPARVRLALRWIESDRAKDPQTSAMERVLVLR